MRKNHLLLVLALAIPSLSLAAIVEEVLDVPVSVKTMYGQEVNQAIKVTVFRDDQREKAPYLVLNHGRPATVAGFAGMKRQRYSDNSRYFVALGFVVLVPTRVGYGETGGPDVEDSGRCESRNFAPAYAVAADQTAAVLDFAANLAYVDRSRGVVVGQSFGGMTSITLSTRQLPGLIAAVNFAGGGGGNPASRPANPCSYHRLAALFEDYGRASRIPTLWFYSENDRYWGAELPKEWFQAFSKAGGKGKFVELPPYKDDGHGIFSGNRDAWKSEFETFLRDTGFTIPASARSISTPGLAPETGPDR